MKYQLDMASFIAFVFDAKHDVPLDHTNQNLGCAIGMFAGQFSAHPHLTDHEHSCLVWSALRRQSREAMTPQLAELLVADDRSDTEAPRRRPVLLMDALDDIRLMEERCPTMGALQNFIMRHYPGLVPDNLIVLGSN